MLVQFFGFEIRANLFLGEMSETGAIFLRLRKATGTGVIFHPRLQCNFQNCYCVAVARESLQHQYTARWQNLQTKCYLKSFYYFCNFSEGVALPALDMLQREICACDGNAIICFETALPSRADNCSCTRA